MIDETLSKLEKTIREATSTGAATREELLRLLTSLRSELTALGESDQERAIAVADLAQRATEEATSSGPAEAVGDLERTMKEFEATHPRLLGILDAFFRTLSDAGV